MVSVTSQRSLDPPAWKWDSRLSPIVTSSLANSGRAVAVVAELEQKPRRVIALDQPVFLAAVIGLALAAQAAALCGSGASAMPSWISATIRVVPASARPAGFSAVTAQVEREPQIAGLS